MWCAGAHYTPPRSDIVQCKNCTRIGHRAHVCHLKTVCMFCAKNHIYTKCPLIKQKEQPAGHIPVFLTKCGLCSAQHTALSMDCPRKLAHINKKSSTEPDEFESNTITAQNPLRKPATRIAQPPRQVAPARARSVSPLPNRREPGNFHCRTQTRSPEIVQEFPTPNESRGRPRKEDHNQQY